METATGVTWATLPTSSSACMMRFMRATGNLVFISMLLGLGFLYCGCEFGWDWSCGGGKVEEVEGSLFMRGPRAEEDMSG